jgi:hypothetical protein
MPSRSGDVPVGDYTWSALVRMCNVASLVMRLTANFTSDISKVELVASVAIRYAQFVDTKWYKMANKSSLPGTRSINLYCKCI